ncbi:unnamed protein product [Protopolystoma xenopodis]|uniref:Uncharacterized protein n=1 Tax=Protopolystoma xenopodis TaxID=117903 RepID=A0A3S5BZI9_9PLAT|nr:unnamed protein product [Protopolystoma xenopodis]
MNLRYFSRADRKPVVPAARPNRLAFKDPTCYRADSSKEQQFKSRDPAFHTSGV